MVTDKYVLQGGGGHSRVIIDVLLASNNEVLGIFDPKVIAGLPVPYLGPYVAHTLPEAKAIVAIGNNVQRKSAAKLTTHAFGHAVHPSATVSPHTSFGVGGMIVHGSIIQSGSHLGNHVIVNTGAQIDHDCRIADFVHVGPGSILCGAVDVGEGAFIGAGAVILPGIRIGEWSIVGAGAVVVHDVPGGATVTGNPARITKGS